MDECEDPTLNNCDVNAMCINTSGSFSCMCNNGYFGSGTDCELCYMGDGTDCDMCNPDKPFCLGYTKDCIGIVPLNCVASPWHALDCTIF